MHQLRQRELSKAARGWGALLVFQVVLSCGYDRADRWDEDEIAAASSCNIGTLRCSHSRVESCEAEGGLGQWRVTDDCVGKGLVCAPALFRCTRCLPETRTCDGNKAVLCSEDGQSFALLQNCDGTAQSACRDGACVDLCAHAAIVRSNVGCEYWGVDLDNAVIKATGNAAAQQYAIVVSNPQPDLTATVKVEQDDSLPGEPPQVKTVISAAIPPLNLHVFKLGPREVDGSPEGEYDTGTGTALTRHAYRVTSPVPVVAFQFNPLDNVAVFSNDASLLKPVEALVDTPGTMLTSYVVLGWPQTIAHTDDPDTNFDPASPINLRAFVAIVGTRPDTHIRFRTATEIIPGGNIPRTPAGSVIEATLQPFEVLNLETGDFKADFTGSLVEADQPVVVFSGNEASDSPWYDRLSERQCCADHLEQQLDPLRTLGTNFIAPHSPSRTRALSEAGTGLSIADEPEFFRVLAVSDQGPTLVWTSLPPPNDTFTLSGRGAFHEIAVRSGEVTQHYSDFLLWSDRPIVLANIQPGYQASFVRDGMPGGDPSLILIPPIEQYRSRYVFLTPDKYSFDFVSILAPREAEVVLDGAPINSWGCSVSPADGLRGEERGKAESDYIIYRCQLSFPVVAPQYPYTTLPGQQNDGVHRVDADQPVMVFAYGFDERVSYGYAAGTQLETLGPVR